LLNVKVLFKKNKKLSRLDLRNILGLSRLFWEYCY